MAGDIILWILGLIIAIIIAVWLLSWLYRRTTKARGFVRTGMDVTERRAGSAFESSKPGVFAVGDVRSGSVKRVASGVGEGSVCISAVHSWLSEAGGD